MKDKIIQIVQGDMYIIYGISENGNLYALMTNNDGIRYWKFICNSPGVEYLQP